MSFLWSYWADSNRRPADYELYPFDYELYPFDYERKIDTFLHLF